VPISAISELHRHAAGQADREVRLRPPGGPPV